MAILVVAWASLITLHRSLTLFVPGAVLCSFGLAFASTGLGLCHAVGHALSARLGVAHGVALAVVVVAGAAVFALIHLPRYGVTAMPLDFSVGLALGGLRALTGRVMPGAIAHVMADWGAWFAV